MSTEMNEAPQDASMEEQPTISMEPLVDAYHLASPHDHDIDNGIEECEVGTEDDLTDVAVATAIAHIEFVVEDEQVGEVLDITLTQADGQVEEREVQLPPTDTWELKSPHDVDQPQG